MDPLLPPKMDQEADADARRKIQFSVPSSLATELDPRQVEMVSAEGSNHKTNLFWINPHSPVEFAHKRVSTCCHWYTVIQAVCHEFGVWGGGWWSVDR